MNMLLGTVLHVLAVGLRLQCTLSLSRIDCFTNDVTNSSNIRPRISRETSFSGTAGASIEDYVGYDWPLNTYLNFSRALPSQLYGQYVCRSSIGYYTRNYVHNSKFMYYRIA